MQLFCTGLQLERADFYWCKMLLNHFRELLSLFPLDPCNFFGPSAAQALRALDCVEITFFFVGSVSAPLLVPLSRRLGFLMLPV